MHEKPVRGGVLAFDPRVGGEVDPDHPAPEAPSKRILNTHIAAEEHAFLKAEARRRSMTITHYLRNLIREDMVRKGALR